MDVLIILLFISLVFVTGAVLLFLRGVFSGDFEQGDRISLLPLETEGPVASATRGEEAGPAAKQPPEPGA